MSQNRLPFHYPEPVPDPIDWCSCPEFIRPVKRMLQLHNERHPRRRIAQSAKLELLHECSQFVVCRVRSPLGEAFAVYCFNSPFGQATVYHPGSIPSVRSKAEAIEQGKRLHRLFQRGNAN